MHAYDTMNPAAVAVQLLLTAGIAMFCTEPLLLGISLGCAATFFLVRNGRKHPAFHCCVLGAAVLLALLNPLWNQHGATVLLVINDRAVTAEALLYGCTAGLRLAAVLYWFRIFSDLMTSAKLFYLLRFCSPKLALVFSMAVRNLALFRQQMRKIQDTQRALGLYREEHLIDDVRGGLRVFSVLLTWALENGIITANSMAARGYDNGKRSSSTVFRWHAADIRLLVCTFLFAAAVIAPAVRGALTWQFYPICEPPARGTAYGIAAAAYAVLSLLPLIHETKEVLTWRCLRSNI